MAVDPERAVLGAMLMSDVALPNLVTETGLTANQFYYKKAAKAWDAMVAVHMDGGRVDVLTTAGQMTKEHGPSDGYVPYLEELTADCPSVGNALKYGRQVVEDHEWRLVEEAGHDLVTAAKGKDFEAKSRAEATLMASKGRSADSKTPAELGQQLYDYFEGGPPKVWRTPFEPIDNGMGGGLRPGGTTLLSGWTGDGKSVLTDNILCHVSKQGAKTHLYINEMTDLQRSLRILSMISGIEASKLTKKDLGVEEKTRAMKFYGEIPFGITQVADWSPVEIARDIRFNGWDVCAVDMISQHGDSEDVAQASKILSAAAKMSNCHILGVVHLNEARSIGATPPKPTLRDIRGSGMLKNDAEQVLFVYRNRQDDVVTDFASLELAKHRHGFHAESELYFDGKHVKFSEI